MRNEDLNAMDLLDRINTSIKSELSPLTTKIDALDNKVSELYRDRVTRVDLEKLTSAFVPRDAYEARHAQLIERDKDLENDTRELRTKLETIQNSLEEKIKHQQEIQLSEKDRTWIRMGQVMGALGLLGAALEFILSHIHFN